MAPKKGLLQKLEEGVVIGDGGYVFALEKRGYVTAGPWTPEAVVEHPEAVKGLHREFLRAGSDVMQAFTFYASDGKLSNRGNKAGQMYTCSGINKAACELARAVADEDPEQNTLVAGGLSQTPKYLSDAGKEAVQAEFKVQVNAFLESKVDFLVAEYFEYVEEIEWAIEVCRESALPVVASMCIGPKGDLHGVSAGDCAVRMARAGAHVVGVNCNFDPFVCLETIRVMKAGLEAADLHPYLIVQPLGFLTPDAKEQGYIDLPECPFAMEPRLCTRWDVHKFAREAYDLGVRYIGGCCGFEAYHIRALAEELVQERGGRVPAAGEKHIPWGGGLAMHTKPWVRARAGRDYWENLRPATGRPFSPSMSVPGEWGVVQGSEDLKQNSDAPSEQEMALLKKRAK